MQDRGGQAHEAIRNVLGRARRRRPAPATLPDTWTSLPSGLESTERNPAQAPGKATPLASLVKLSHLNFFVLHPGRVLTECPAATYGCVSPDCD